MRASGIPTQPKPAASMKFSNPIAAALLLLSACASPEAPPPEPAPVPTPASVAAAIEDKAAAAPESAKPQASPDLKALEASLRDKRLSLDALRAQLSGMTPEQLIGEAGQRLQTEIDQLRQQIQGLSAQVEKLSGG